MFVISDSFIIKTSLVKRPHMRYSVNTLLARASPISPPLRYLIVIFGTCMCYPLLNVNNFLCNRCFKVEHFIPSSRSVLLRQHGLVLIFSGFACFKLKRIGRGRKARELCLRRVVSHLNTRVPSLNRSHKVCFRLIRAIFISKQENGNLLILAWKGRAGNKIQGCGRSLKEAELMFPVWSSTDVSCCYRNNSKTQIISRKSFEKGLKNIQKLEIGRK